MQLIPVYIQELCQDHDYVVIPGLGGFMKRYRAGQDASYLIPFYAARNYVRI